MVAKNVFEKLVETLSADERRDFIRRLTKAPDETPLGPLPDEDDGDLETVWERRYAEMGFFQKLLLMIKALFTGRDVKTLVQDRLLADLAAQIEKICPGMFNFRLHMIHAPFYQELKDLLEGLKVFRKPFTAAFGQNKADFLAFLVGLHLEDVQARLLEETNHWKIYESSPERTSKDIKAIVEGNFRLALDAITPDRRKVLYEGIKTLNGLRGLVFVNEEKLLKPFQLVTVAGAPGSASVEDLRGPLIELWEKLAQFTVPPPAKFLEGLFLFYFQDRLENTDAPLQAILQDSMERALDGLARIRAFNNRVPMAKIVALLNNSLHIHTKPAGGAEDWFITYKKFWQSKIERDFQLFSRERAERLLMADIYQFLEIQPEDFRKEAMYPPYYPGRMPTHGDKTLTFMKLFMSKIFMTKMNPLLKIILLEGDFYKKHNRGVFTDTYNFILTVPDKVNFFQKNFGPEGEWGLALKKLANTTDEEILVHQIKDIFHLAGDWVESFLTQAMPVFTSFMDVLKGLNKGDSSGRYDTLANLSAIGGKSNMAFRKELDTMAKRWEKFLTIVRDLSGLE